MHPEDFQNTLKIKNSIAFSYRNQGIPSPGELKEIFLTQKKLVKNLPYIIITML